MSRINIQLKDSTNSIEHICESTFVRDGFLCINVDNNIIYKYPISSIFRIVEDSSYYTTMEGLPKDMELEVTTDLSSTIKSNDFLVTDKSLVF